MDFVILTSKTTQLKCRGNTGPISETRPVLFEPNEVASGPEDLRVNETVETVKLGFMSLVKVDGINTTNHGIVLKKHTVIEIDNTS